MSAAIVCGPAIAVQFLDEEGVVEHVAGVAKTFGIEMQCYGLPAAIPAGLHHRTGAPLGATRQVHVRHATAARPLRWMIESRRSAGPPGRFTSRSQSDTRLRDTLR